MYSYLSKKIILQNNLKVCCIAWNKTSGHIALGGEDGLLKILQLEYAEKSNETTINFTTNQNLELHNDNVYLLAWNERHMKLTSCDESGTIILWSQNDDLWCEETISNRKKSKVISMKWSPNNEKICIIYEDGTVIVGSVIGDRIWEKELKYNNPTCLSWIPNSTMIVFGFDNGHMLLYDDLGNFCLSLEIKYLESEQSLVVDVDWYHRSNSNGNSLAIASENGRIQLMFDENDTNPVIIFTGMLIFHCRWNDNGTLLAISGRQHIDDEETNLIHFYGSFGEHLGILKIPGRIISDFAWGTNSLHLSVVVEDFVYFATIQNRYKWTYLKDTFVITTKNEKQVLFWNINKNTISKRKFPRVLDINGFHDHCVLAVFNENENIDRQYGLFLCNKLGICVDSQYVEIEIDLVVMNSMYVVACSKSTFLVWQYKTPKSLIYTAQYTQARLYHIDKDIFNHYKTNEMEDYTIYPICTADISNEMLVIGRESGMIQFYILPDVILINKYELRKKPLNISINCNSTKLAVIDLTGVLNVVEIDSNSKFKNKKLQQRNNVWSTSWSKDKPETLAFTEKCEMYIFDGECYEESVPCSGYIYSFDSLTVRTILLDAIVKLSKEPHQEEHLIPLETETLRNLRNLLKTDGIEEGVKYVEQHEHPFLWRIIAEKALIEQMLEIAETSLIKLHDYAGIRFVKKLSAISSTTVRKARVGIYFKQYEKVEQLYIDSNRYDLVLDMYRILGCWEKIIHYSKHCIITWDSSMNNDIGDYKANLGDWNEALKYYNIASNRIKMVECYQRSENYNALEMMIDGLGEGDSLLKDIANIFASDGICEPAIRAYVKSGDVKAALNLCILHSKWDQAFELANHCNLPEIFDLFEKYSNLLIKKAHFKPAITINMQTKNYLTAAKFVFEIAQNENKKIVSDIVKVKKLFVFVGFLVYMHKTKTKFHSTDEDVMLEDAWKGAEAYHYFLLVQRQIYNKQYHDAMVTAYKLQVYTSYISEVEIYALLALSAYLDESYGICSKAFIKLKSIPHLTTKDLNSYNILAFDIFTLHDPTDIRQYKCKCFNCHEYVCDWNTACPVCYSHFPTCIASGRSIIETTELWQCRTCHHVALDSKIDFPNICPLCHASS